MSQATPANPPHMLTRPDGRHEYVRALPTHWQAYRRLPRQLRWALPRQRPLAIAAAQALNTSFAALTRVEAQRNLGEDYILYALEEILEGHRRDQRALRHPFGELITPAALAKTGLQQKHQQLRALEARHAPIQRPVGSEELWLVLHDDGLSGDLKLLPFERYCVSLGTQDEGEARWRAAYVLAALTALRQWKKDGFLHALHPLAARTLALDQFVQQVCRVEALVPLPAPCLYFLSEEDKP